MFYRRYWVCVQILWLEEEKLRFIDTYVKKFWICGWIFNPKSVFSRETRERQKASIESRHERPPRDSHMGTALMAALIVMLLVDINIPCFSDLHQILILTWMKSAWKSSKESTTLTKELCTCCHLYDKISFQASYFKLVYTIT